MAHKTYSQSGQDVFSNYLCNYDDGYFLDIGCSDGITSNNSYLLEQRGWVGLLMDIDKNGIENCKKIRKSDSFQVDLTKVDILDLFVENNTPKVIDYISFDVDSASETLFKKFPWQDYKFKVMTFEHDVYRLSNRLQKLSRDVLSSHGYKIVCKNVQNNGNPYEDWWINPKNISESLYHNLICENLNYEKIIEMI